MTCDGYKTSASNYDDHLARIRELMIKYRENFAIILCGDFNASITCDPRHCQDHALRAFCSEMELIQPESYQDGRTFHMPMDLPHKLITSLLRENTVI